MTFRALMIAILFFALVTMATGTRSHADTLKPVEDPPPGGFFWSDGDPDPDPDPDPVEGELNDALDRLLTEEVCDDLFERLENRSASGDLLHVFVADPGTEERHSLSEMEEFSRLLAFDSCDEVEPYWRELPPDGDQVELEIDCDGTLRAIVRIDLLECTAEAELQ